MMSTTISLWNTCEAPNVSSLAIPSGQRFMRVLFGTQLTVLLPGQDQACVDYVRAFAAALVAEAERVEQALVATEIAETAPA